MWKTHGFFSCIQPWRSSSSLSKKDVIDSLIFIQPFFYKLNTNIYLKMWHFCVALHVEDKYNIAMPPWWWLWAHHIQHQGYGGTNCCQWVQLSHAYWRLICIDDSQCPAFHCVELSTAMAPCFAKVMMPKSPRICFFHRQADSHYASHLNHKVYQVMRIENKEKPAYLFGFAYHRSILSDR